MKLDFKITEYAADRHGEPKKSVTAKLLQAEYSGASARKLLRLFSGEIRQGRLIPYLYVVGRGRAVVAWNDDQDVAHISGLSDGQMLRLVGTATVCFEDRDKWVKVDKTELARLHALFKLRLAVPGQLGSN